MLERTFTHAPGIGPGLERKIWQAGVINWGDLRGAKAVRGIGASKKAGLEAHLLESERALERQTGRFFQECMPSREMWRLFPEFRDNTVYLDIETTGLDSWSEITVISLFDGVEARALVKGRDLDKFPELIRKYSLIVTYNGASFDLPFLHRSFDDFSREYAHIDLRYPLARLGFKGGLKNAERMAGINREGALQSVDGYMAVLLWREYQRGNQAALSTLLRYGLEDVVNLRDLLVLTYNLSVDQLPLAIPHQLVGKPYKIDVPFDPSLVRRLSF